MKTGFFTSQEIKNNLDTNQKFNICGLNSGNLIFRESLKEVLDVNLLSYSASEEEIEKYDQFITTELIWIRPETEMFTVRNLLDKVKDKPIIPISAGLQANTFDPNFKLHPNTVKMLQEIAERATIGVRGNYTAEIFNKYGIKNIRVIGCPSLYYGMNYDFNIKTNKRSKINKVNTMFRTIYGNLSIAEKHFMIYCANRQYDFVEQTNHVLSNDNINDKKLFNYLITWLNNKKQIFFDAVEWKEYLEGFDFSMGARFHGNIVALWAGVPALFMTVDSRTTEMCEFFNLPTMKLADFDMEKPIEYYYELADYTLFNKNYNDKLDNFIDFCKINNINVRPRIDKYYDRKIELLSKQIDNLNCINNKLKEVYK